MDVRRCEKCHEFVVLLNPIILWCDGCFSFPSIFSSRQSCYFLRCHDLLVQKLISITNQVVNLLLRSLHPVFWSPNFLLAFIPLQFTSYVHFSPKRTWIWPLRWPAQEWSDHVTGWTNEHPSLNLVHPSRISQRVCGTFLRLLCGFLFADSPQFFTHPRPSPLPPSPPPPHDACFLSLFFFHYGFCPSLSRLWIPFSSANFILLLLNADWPPQDLVFFPSSLHLHAAHYSLVSTFMNYNLDIVFGHSLRLGRHDHSSLEVVGEGLVFTMANHPQPTAEVLVIRLFCVVWANLLTCRWLTFAGWPSVFLSAWCRCVRRCVFI